MKKNNITTDPFIIMRDELNTHLNEMMKSNAHLFTVNVDKDDMWNHYLDSYPAGTNEIYRERREYDCSCCRGFIKNIGNVIAIKDNKITTIWSFETTSQFAPVVQAMDAYIKKLAAEHIDDIYLSKERKIGCHHNFEMLEKLGPKQWDHFYVELEDKFVARNSERKGEVLNNFRTAKEVFKRSLDEITLDALDVILELINSGALYKGPEYKRQVETMRRLKKIYENLPAKDRDVFAWEQSVKLDAATSKIRNTAIGTLLVDVSAGRGLDEAVKAYESITAPANYKRSKPIFTQRMLEEAQKKIEDLGFKESLPRRYATLNDITVNDILFANRDASKRIEGAEDIFGELSKETKDSAKKFSKVESIPVQKFLQDVLPTASMVEVYLENKHAGNMVSLIAPQNAGTKSMFKWNNNFSWAYAGNMTDSMKERVKAAGGKVDGDLRFSIQWNEDGRDNCDLDAHCTEPNGNEICFNNCRKPSSSRLGGQLDVDIIHPDGKIAVENITWPDRRKMMPGKYKFFVNQYSGSVKNGFRAEIEFDGQVYSFDYPKSMRTDENVIVAIVTLDKNGNFSIEEKIPSSMSSRNIWGLKTNEFVPVTVICKSPNYWDAVENKTGHEHLFFMLDGCKNEESPSGMFNEFLVNELYEHKKVMEALGNKLRCKDADDQLSGVGFALDKRAELIVKVTGATERVMKVIF